MAPTHLVRRTLHLAAALTLTGCAALPFPSPESESPTESASQPAPSKRASQGDPGGMALAEPLPVPAAEPDRTSVEEAASPAGEPAEGTSGDAGDAAPDDPDRPGSLWDRLRSGFALPEAEHPRVSGPLEWYAGHPRYIERTVERAEPFLRYILDEVESRGMPTEIALLPAVESAFKPFAYSHGRAAGLWQFIPSTGRHFDLRQTWWYDGRRDIVASTRAALDYLEHLRRRFDGDWLLALAAYNAGGGTVSAAQRRAGDEDAGFWDLSLSRETSGYVPKLLALKRLIADPAAFDIALPPLQDEPRIEVVDVGSQIDLALAADLADISIETLYRLNPGYNRWATDPEGPHRLIVPIGRAEAFREALAERPPEERLRWTRHRIAKGETLSHIADRHHTTVAMLREVNDLRGTTIRAGDHLVIPVAAGDPSDYALSASQRRAAVQGTERDGVKRVHVVERGDTLWDIAREHGVSVRTLAEWNGMAPGDTLRPGQRLVVWVSRQTAARRSWMTGPDREQRMQQVRYHVRRGDSLAAIARRFGVSVSQLKSWNQVGRYLQPGQRLTLYVDVTNGS